MYNVFDYNPTIYNPHPAQEVLMKKVVTHWPIFIKQNKRAGVILILDCGTYKGAQPYFTITHDATKEYTPFWKDAQVIYTAFCQGKYAAQHWKRTEPMEIWPKDRLGPYRKYDT